jgi:hypothetical protein
VPRRAPSCPSTGARGGHAAQRHAGGRPAAPHEAAGPAHTLGRLTASLAVLRLDAAGPFARAVDDTLQPWLQRTRRVRTSLLGPASSACQRRRCTRSGASLLLRRVWKGPFAPWPRICT